MESRTGGIAFVTAGDATRRTGGNLYNRRVLAGLRDTSELSGQPVEEVVLANSRPDEAAAALRSEVGRLGPSLVIVDSIALPPAAALAGWIRQDVQARLVVLMHMLPSDNANANDRDRLSSHLRDRVAQRTQERQLLTAADRIVAVSPDLRDRLIAAGAPAERVDVVAPGWDGCWVGGTRRRRSRSGPLHFLCVANWSPGKGIHEVVEALGQLARQDLDVALDLVGEEGGDAYARQVRDEIDRFGLTARVYRWGDLPPEQLAARYVAADVFVLPSRSEGFGIVYAEAMGFGLPVIACHVGPLPWLVEADCGVLVTPGDKAALRKAMRRLATDPVARRHFGLAGRRRVRRLPTWDETVASFAAVIGSQLRD